jgi:DNA helicase-2/ATP-dependent DNA helicase PcrA
VLDPRSPLLDASALLGSLNPEQELAVTHGDGACLVVAGAGSGKTRVLTHRVAWLLAERGVRPEEVLAFTFTNRAAREMRERLASLLGGGVERLWVGTFHGTCLRLLRREAERIGYPSAFTVYDRDDQTRLLGRILGDLDLAGGSGPKTSFYVNRIGGAKNALVTPETYAATAVTPIERQAARVYDAYQQALGRTGAMDFDDLIARAVWLLEGDQEARSRWSRRFRHVLVDEYQDTNHAQFRLVAAFAAGSGNITAVGDEDQSIYGWRGADLSNVLEFERRFPGASVIRLERNYRSTGNIVDAASAVIANNRLRRGKRLWTDHPPGAVLRLLLTGDEEAEAARLAEETLRWVARGRRASEVAVLFRTNAQSRALELAFRQRGVPYELVGGVSFYERREVKDLLAYLRVAANPRDRVSFLRILNVPRRGLGAESERRLAARLAAEPDAMPAAALAALHRGGELPRAGAAGAAALLRLFDAESAHAEAAPGALLERLLADSRYTEYLDEEYPEDAADRRENVSELVNAARLFEAAHEGATLGDFLAETALVADVDRWSEAEDRAVLLTAHNAKGLEFPVVAIAGCEEGIFPHASSLDDEGELEEERRLFYVALTRAREEVLLTAAAFRRRYDHRSAGELSRFVREIPSELVSVENPPGWTSGSAPRRAAARKTHESPAPRARAHEAIGRPVHHEIFGRGTVVDVEGDGPGARYVVRFASVGVKKVLGRFLEAEG